MKSLCGDPRLSNATCTGLGGHSQPLWAATVLSSPPVLGSLGGGFSGWGLGCRGVARCPIRAGVGQERAGRLCASTGDFFSCVPKLSLAPGSGGRRSVNICDLGE